MQKIANRDASPYVASRTPFKANNLSADFENGAYVVRSYKHYPIFVFKGGEWFENDNTYSVTTAKQMTQSGWRVRPVTTLKSTEELKTIIRGSAENSSLKFMNAFLKLGDLTAGKNETLEEKVKYKEKIIFSTMGANVPDWQPPKDWDTLSDEEKLKRLDKIEEVCP